MIYNLKQIEHENNSDHGPRKIFSKLSEKTTDVCPKGRRLLGFSPDFKVTYISYCLFIPRGTNYVRCFESFRWVSKDFLKTVVIKVQSKIHLYNIVILLKEKWNVGK